MGYFKQNNFAQKPFIAFKIAILVVWGNLDFLDFLPNSFITLTTAYHWGSIFPLLSILQRVPFLLSDVTLNDKH